MNDTQRYDGRSAVAAVFVLVVGLTYSDDVIEFLTRFDGGHLADLRWGVFFLDVLLVAGTALLRWYITGGPRDSASFLHSLLHGWWTVGAALVVLLHLMLLTTAAPPGKQWAVADSLWLTLLTNAAFVVAMALLLMSALAAPGSRWWVLPVAIGTFVAQAVSAMWYPLIDQGNNCADNISPDYFNGMVQVLPVLLVTLGLEVNYLRSTNVMREPGQRAVAVLTVILLCVAEVLSFSMLAKGHRVVCGPAAMWHEYVAFVITVHATAIGLATLAWLLLANSWNANQSDPA